MQPAQPSAPPASQIIYESTTGGSDAPPPYDEAQTTTQQIEGSSSAAGGAALNMTPTPNPAPTAYYSGGAATTKPLDMTPSQVVVLAPAATAGGGGGGGGGAAPQSYAMGQPTMFMPSAGGASAAASTAPFQPQKQSANPTAGAFVQGRAVALKSVASDKYLLIVDEKHNVNGTGGMANDPCAGWRVHLVSGAGTDHPIIKLESLRDKGCYLRVGPEKGLNAGGDGGRTYFTVSLFRLV